MPSVERLLSLSREGVWLVLGQVAAVAGSLVGIRLLTELLAPASYGELTLGLTIATLLNQTILGPLVNGVSRFYAPASEAAELNSLLKAVRSWIVRCSVPIGLTIPLMAVV